MQFWWDKNFTAFREKTRKKKSRTKNKAENAKREYNKNQWGGTYLVPIEDKVRKEQGRQ